MKKECKLAMVQMSIRPGNPAANVAHAVELLREARSLGADMALLPEAMTVGWTHPRTRELAEQIPTGPSCRALAEAARGLQMYICAGLVERAGEKVFNSAILIDRAGQIVLHHRKLNELEIASEYYDVGDRLEVAETEFGRIGLMICADGFADGQCIARTLGYMGARLILSPSAWAVEADHDNIREPYGKLWMDNYGAVARDFKLWIAGCSNVGPIEGGPWSGRKCIGSSLLVGPEGTVHWQGRHDLEDLAVQTIHVEPAAARGTGWSRIFDRAQE